MNTEFPAPALASGGDSNGLAAVSPADPKSRQHLRAERRAAEWAMHRKLMAAAQCALDNFLSDPRRVTAQDIVRLTELGLDLGRSACGLLPGQTEGSVHRGPTISLEFRAAIEKGLRPARARRVYRCGKRG